LSTIPYGGLQLNYNCPTFYKSISEPEPYRPRELEECRDLLLRTILKDGFCIAIFKFGAVALPEELEPKLKELMGHEVACLRLDNKYNIRDLTQEAEDAAR